MQVLNSELKPYRHYLTQQHVQQEYRAAFTTPVAAWVRRNGRWCNDALLKMSLPSRLLYEICLPPYLHVSFATDDSQGWAGDQKRSSQILRSGASDLVLECHFHQSWLLFF